MELIKKIKPWHIGLLGIIMTILGTILPTIYIANVPLNYISGDGKFIVLFMLLTGIYMWRKKAILSLIPTCLSCGILIRYLWETAPTKALEEHLMEIANYGPGLYLMLIGLCLCLFYGATGVQIEKQKEKVPFNAKYFFLGWILPIIGVYMFVRYDKKDREKAKNSLNGAAIGFIIFFIIVIMYSLA